MFDTSQILLLPIILFIVFKTLVAYKNKELSKNFLITWVGFWFLVLFFLINPIVLSKLASFVGIGRGVDLAAYLSIIILFYLIYKIYTQLSNLEHKITNLTRKMTLDRARDNEKNSKK